MTSTVIVIHQPLNQQQYGLELNPDLDKGNVALATYGPMCTCAATMLYQSTLH